MQDNSTMDAARLNALERDMGKALQKLEDHATRFGEIITKMEKAAEERTEVAVLKSQVATINAHVDAMSKSVNERLQKIESIVERGQGLRFGWNLLLSGIGMAAGAYAFWREHVR